MLSNSIDLEDISQITTILLMMFIISIKKINGTTCINMIIILMQENKHHLSTIIFIDLINIYSIKTIVNENQLPNDDGLESRNVTAAKILTKK
jgi:hypothetical protein